VIESCVFEDLVLASRIKNNSGLGLGVNSLALALNARFLKALLNQDEIRNKDWAKMEHKLFGMVSFCSLLKWFR